MVDQKRFLTINSYVSSLFLFLILFLYPLAGSGQFIQIEPESVGLSSERLEKLDHLIQQQIDNGKMAGVNTLVLRDGKAAYLKSHGMMDREENKPMRRDAIFRIASMSKAVTSVAVMMLYEEGHFMLSDPVYNFIPAF